MQSEVLLNGTDKQATENHVVPAQEPTVTNNLVVARVDRPGHIWFESEGATTSIMSLQNLFQIEHSNFIFLTVNYVVCLTAICLQVKMAMMMMVRLMCNLKNHQL
jgi:hypothetical protein